MRCFFHTVTDTEFIRDRDGEDFADRQMAEQEAAQVARDLMAEELRNGKPMPVRWKVLLALADDTVLMSLSFSQLIPAPSLASRLRSFEGALQQLMVRRERYLQRVGTYPLPVYEGGAFVSPDETDQRHKQVIRIRGPGIRDLPRDDVHMLQKSLVDIALMRTSIAFGTLQIKRSFRAIRETDELLERVRREGF